MGMEQVTRRPEAARRARGVARSGLLVERGRRCCLRRP
jgi:hypothetical protein